MGNFENTKKSQKIYAEDGGELLRYSLSYPTFSESTHGIKKINEFYRTIAEKCEGFCVRELRAFCERRRLESSIYTPLFYKLDCRVAFDNDECVSIVIQAVLKNIGASCVLGEYSTVHTFSKHDGLIMTQAQIIKKYMPEVKNPKKYIKKNKGALFRPSENGIIHFTRSETLLSDNI
jgi:hypothetical protein